MDVYLYSYNCPRWYGTVSGLRNFTTDEKTSKKEAVKKMVNTSNTLSGSQSCSVSLLLKYKLSINSIETYPNVMQLPTSLQNEVTKEVASITE